MNYTCIEVNMKFRNGEKEKIILCKVDDDLEEQAVAWAESTGSGQQYGYDLTWKVIDNKEIIKEQIALRIKIKQANILYAKLEIENLENDLKELI